LRVSGAVAEDFASRIILVPYWVMTTKSRTVVTPLLVPVVAEVELDAEEVLPLLLGDAVRQAVAVDVDHLHQGAGKGGDGAGAERPERRADVDGGAAGEVEGVESVERRQAAERGAQGVDDVLATIALPDEPAGVGSAGRLSARRLRR
jgi:hypothetical protein